MKRNEDISKIAFIGTYPPRKCGIATFTHDVRNAVAKQYPSTDCYVIPINDIKQGYVYPDEVRFEIEKEDLASYRSAADYINFHNTDIACVQHEFGIFGGTEGSHILGLLKNLNIPIVTTLHTVLEKPNKGQMMVMHELADLSSRLIVMSEKGRSFLEEVYDVPDDKIDLIPHGIPDMPFVDPNFYKDKYGVEGMNVILTFGLLSPNKGIEYVLRALPEIIMEFPKTTYIVLGATHPDLVRTNGETYRMSLERQASELNISKNVVFYNRFVELEELKEFIGAADIYITPYLNRAQITSGTLAYSFGCGKAVISTPYWHAEELLADGRGILVPFGDSAKIAEGVLRLLRDDSMRHAMRKKAYMLGRNMVWSHVSRMYYDSFIRSRTSKIEYVPPQSIKSLDEEGHLLPEFRLDHLKRITDSTGILQHSVFGIPNRREGYCTDDNARALVLTVLLEQVGLDGNEIHDLASRYAAFIDYAYNNENGKFRNFMAYDRRWLEKEGSQESNGRALWAVGTCVGRSKNKYLQLWAAGLFERALEGLKDSTSPRAWAFATLGACEYSRRLGGDRRVNQFNDDMITRLINAYLHTRSEDWKWYEDKLTYNNARLPHALIENGAVFGNERTLAIGLESLEWLSEIFFTQEGIFSPVGTNGFYPRGGKCARFDQQPIEAYSFVSACIAAYKATGRNHWIERARRAFEWFLGRNDINIPLYDSLTGGCHDGLHVDRVNRTQVAESMMSFLLSLAEMKINENIRYSFKKGIEPVAALGCTLHGEVHAKNPY